MNMIRAMIKKGIKRMIRATKETIISKALFTKE